MDFVQHGAWSGLATVSPFIVFGVTNLVILLPLFLLGWILGALPDMLGEVGRQFSDESIPRFFLYEEAHRFKGYFKKFVYVLPFWLHMRIDKYWHKSDGNWKSWGHWGDAIGWVLFFVIIAMMIFLPIVYVQIVLGIYLIIIMVEYYRFFNEK